MRDVNDCETLQSRLRYTQIKAREPGSGSPLHRVGVGRIRGLGRGLGVGVALGVGVGSGAVKAYTLLSAAMYMRPRATMPVVL